MGKAKIEVQIDYVNEGSFYQLQFRSEEDSEEVDDRMDALLRCVMDKSPKRGAYLPDGTLLIQVADLTSLTTSQPAHSATSQPADNRV